MTQELNDVIVHQAKQIKNITGAYEEARNVAGQLQQALITYRNAIETLRPHKEALGTELLPGTEPLAQLLQAQSVPEQQAA